MTVAKSRFSSASNVASVPPCSTLQTKDAAFGQHLAGELGCGFRQRHDPQVIGLAVAGGIRRHIGKHHVNFAAEHGLQLLRRRFVEKVELEEFDVHDRLHVENIERDDAAVRTDAPHGDLAPAAGRSAQIDNARARFEHMIFVVDFGELIGGAGAKAFALGAHHVRIAELALEPGPRRQCALLLVLEPRHL